MDAIAPRADHGEVLGLVRLGAGLRGGEVVPIAHLFHSERGGETLPRTRGELEVHQALRALDAAPRALVGEGRGGLQELIIFIARGSASTPPNLTEGASDAVGKFARQAGIAVGGVSAGRAAGGGVGRRSAARTAAIATVVVARGANAGAATGGAQGGPLHLKLWGVEPGVEAGQSRNEPVDGSGELATVAKSAHVGRGRGCGRGSVRILQKLRGVRVSERRLGRAHSEAQRSHADRHREPYQAHR